MFGDLIEFECLDVREWLCVNKARNWCEDSPCTGINDYMGSTELTTCSISECGLQLPRSNETSGAANEFRSTLLVMVEVHGIPVRYHLAFPATNGRHINGELFFGYAELFASAKVRCNLCTVNNVLARETGYVRT